MGYLTKTKYVNGLKCERRLWLDRYKPELAAPYDEATLRLFRRGNEVDEAARSRFPSGILMPPAYRDAQAAVEATQEAIAGGADCLFQASFMQDGVLVVVDVLERLQVGWHLIEVKMSASVKDEHLEDASLQRYVVESSGLQVARVSLMHIDTSCVAPDLDGLFTVEDVTERLDEASDVPASLARFEDVLAEPTEPDVAIGRHCLSPRDCPFKAHCWSGFEGRTIYELQDLHHSTQKKLAGQGVLLIEDIPADFALPAAAQGGLERWREKRTDVDVQGLKRLLDQLQYPLAFLDFETDNPPIPEHPGTSPYQQIPFQYSLHVLYEDGSLQHRDYLHTGTDDPRPGLVASLLDEMPGAGSVVAYSASFERRVLDELAVAFPERASELGGAAERLWNQLDVIKKAYRHHAFGASNSIKAVLPVLVPGLTYQGLSVADGTQAQVAFERILQRREGWEELVGALRDYCWLDTLAMVELHRHFMGILEEAEVGS